MKERKSERKAYEVHGKKILVFGDLHLSSSYEGQHINYLKDCYVTMELVRSHCDEAKPDAIVFLGDIIGVREKNIKSREFLMRVNQFFEYLNGLVNGNVFSVKGNHDMGDFTDFDYLVGMGYIKNPLYVDFYNDVNGCKECRFHFVNYGDEHKSLQITEESDVATDVVFGHVDYYISGATNWYGARERVELSQLSNFEGVQQVISGHIHIPSEEVLWTSLPNGESIGLFYLGSPSRTAERFKDCWYMAVEYSEEGGYTECNPYYMGLPSMDEVFHSEESFVLESEGQSEQEVNSERLRELVQEIIEGRLTSGDIEQQIMAVPIADDETKQLALDYYRQAEKGA